MVEAVVNERLWAPAVGRCGRTRSGAKAHIWGYQPGGAWPFAGTMSDRNGIWQWNEDGRSPANRQLDLMAEWKEGVPASPSIDFAKICKGDRVKLGGEFEVVDVDLRAGRASSEHLKIGVGASCLWVHDTAIVAHLPAACPIEVGCQVRGSFWPEMLWDVKAVVGGQAWLSPLMNLSGDRIAPLAQLTRVDETVS